TTGTDGRGGTDSPGGALPGTGSLLFTGPVTASTVRKIACDADIIPVLLGTAGRVLDIGRASRIFPPHIRKALIARDQGCAFPGCTIPASWCEAHHIDYWSRGGSTGTENGTLLCSHHHHLIHKEQWTIQVRAGIPWFIPPPHIDPAQTPRRNNYFRLE
ncbi:HNH endonuclease signature motif containing protein, partial [Arthrobacter sp. PM3]|uniref:HNH endonuclease signature motif containing protein n=1 Tax=Arthrobacter sp. PM3 TaxID=2017685 RepID=UPI001ABF519E